jgi:uridine kinase
VSLQVGLAGPSGSGKTAFSEKVQAFIKGCVVLSMDNYNDPSKLIDENYDGRCQRSFDP